MQQLKILDHEASAPLPEVKRLEKVSQPPKWKPAPVEGGLRSDTSYTAPQQKASGIGFFEQGIMTRGVVLLATVVSCTGGVCYYIVAYAWPLAWPRLRFF